MDKTRNHVIFWVGYFLYNLLTPLSQVKSDMIGHSLVFGLVRNTSICVMFYTFIYLIFPDVLIKKKYILPIINFLCLLFFLGVFSYTIFFGLNYLYPLLFYRFTFNNYIFTVTTVIFRALSLAIPFWMFKRYLFEHQQKEIKNREKHILQKIRLNSQLSGLKNQINPHFMYNILNFLYAQSLSVTPSMADSLLMLSKLMRYSIQDYEKGKVVLEKEINYTQDYIKLEKENNPELNLLTFGTPKDILINKMRYFRVFPQTFLPIVEHCYQCGTYVNYNITLQEKNLFFNGSYTKKGYIEKNFVNENFIKTQKRISSEYNVSMNYNSHDNRYNISLCIGL
jgi:two-component system, LytTR family, sensor kinase